MKQITWCMLIVQTDSPLQVTQKSQVDEFQEYEASSKLTQIFIRHHWAKIKHETSEKKLLKVPSLTPLGAKFQPQEGAATKS